MGEIQKKYISIQKRGGGGAQKTINFGGKLHFTKQITLCTMHHMDISQYI
jgi:hypothetical protein